MKKTISILVVLAMMLGLIPVSAVSEESAATMFIISNPYEQVNWNTFQQYKYSNHVHTSNSDGGSSTRTMAEEHYRLGYHIVAFTDHDFTHVTPNQVRTASPLSLRRMVEMGNNTGENSSLRTSAGGAGMIFVPSTNERSGLTFPELDSVISVAVQSHHINTFWSNLNRVSGESIAAHAARLEQEGTGLAIINHPGRNTGSMHDISSVSAGIRIANTPAIFTPYANIFMANPFLMGLEIINKFDTETQAERVLWDNILQITMPQDRPVWGYSGDDSHHSRAIGFSYNLMLMPELTLSELRIAKETGAFFAFSRVDRQYGIFPGSIENWHWSGSDMSSSSAGRIHEIEVPEINRITVAGDTITINASGHEFIRWYADGVMIHEGMTLDLTAHQSAINSYVRASVGHRSRGVLYTQPFGIQRSGSVRPLPTLQSITPPSPRTVEWGHGNELGFGLPSSVIASTTAGVRPAAVKWDISGAGYDPAIRDREQTFTVTGRVQLNGIANPNNVNLGVSAQITMRAVICTDCSPRAVLVWQPNLAGKTVSGNNIGGDLGIQLADTVNSRAEIVENAIHLTAISGTFRRLRIHTAGNTAGWNPTTSFNPSVNAEYRAVFNLSTSILTSSSGSARIQNRVGDEDALISVNVDNLTDEPREVRHEWRQGGVESLNIDTRNTREGVALIIGDMRIFKLYRCDGNCASPDRFNRCSCVDCLNGVIIVPPVTTPVPPVTTPPVTTAPPMTSPTTAAPPTETTGGGGTATFRPEETTSPAATDGNYTGSITDSTTAPPQMTSGINGTGSPEETTSPPDETASAPETTAEPPVERVFGDVDGNGVVTIVDALEILMYLAGMASALDQPDNFDAARAITGGEKPTIVDALEILMYLAGMDGVLSESKK
jgi:hypothetical protein